ncbi:hypothetical protein J4Q44_G00199040 [Coregonus suidteri]|uniref:NID domain-containing protein n=1 Tax=Coregonus suidteri TaxID=861788 RepID=A0AAN8QT59_9TELE
MLERGNKDLMEKRKKSHSKLQAKRTESATLQAGITFEEDKVAAQILKMAKCTVSCDKDKVYVKPKSLTLDPSVKFEDYLEIDFQKPSNYGGEVEFIKYISRGKEVKAFFTEDAAEMEA